MPAIANSVAGSYVVTATAQGVPAATFNFTNTAGAPALIRIVSGDAQSVAVATAFAPLVVSLHDSSGNPVAGRTLTFTAPVSGASATVASVATTDSSGRASFNATANTKAGSYSVAISGAGIGSPATFSLANKAGAPTSISIIDDARQSASSGAPFGLSLQVLVRDTYGNPVSGATVTFTVPTNEPTAVISSPTDVTGSNGLASIRAIAGAVPGMYVVRASVVGVGQSASFQLTNVAASRGTITGVGGTTQIAQVNNSFAIPLTVAIQDSRGQPVIGTTVTFKSPSTGPSASLSQPTAWTDHQGRASISVAANEQTGSYQVTATAPGFQGTAGFNLQNSTILPTSPVITSIVNAASFVFGAAPGSLQTIFGMNLGAETAIATTNPLPLSLGGIRVLLKAKPVPLLYVSSSQINFQIPVDATAGASDLVVSSGSGPLASTSLRVDNTAPGVFLQLKGDSRRAAALNLDYSLNLPATPTPAGSYISVFLTGIGAVSPVVPSGDAAPISPLSTSSSATSATIGPRPVVIQYTGRAPQSLTDQVNLQVPVDLPPGEYPVIVTINGVRSNSAIISIGPAER